MHDENHAQQKGRSLPRSVLREISQEDADMVEAAVRAYCQLVWQIYDRIYEDPVQYERLKASLAEMRKESSSPEGV